MRECTIGEAARDSGVRVTTIRFYESRGLVPAPPRTGGGRRLYDASAVRRLAFIRHARDLGFPLEAIRDLLALQDMPDRACAEADAIARAQLDAVETRIARLQGLRGELLRMIAACDGGAVSDCAVIESLADHARCETEHKVAFGEIATD